VGASSRALRGTHPFDPCSLHPRAYAQTTSLTGSPRSAAPSKALRQFLPVRTASLRRRWPILGM